MRRRIDFIAIKWIGFVDILAVLLVQGLQSFFLFLVGATAAYYSMPHIIGAASSIPALASALGFIPPSVLKLTPLAVGVVTGSAPWLILFMYIRRRKLQQRQKIDPRQIDTLPDVGPDHIVTAALEKTP